MLTTHTRLRMPSRAVLTDSRDVRRCAAHVAGETQCGDLCMDTGVPDVLTEHGRVVALRVGSRSKHTTASHDDATDTPTPRDGARDLPCTLQPAGGASVDGEHTWVGVLLLSSEHPVVHGDPRFQRRYESHALCVQAACAQTWCWHTLGTWLPSSRGPGHHPLKVAARVRIPLGVQRDDARVRMSRQTRTPRATARGVLVSCVPYGINAMSTRRFFAIPGWVSFVARGRCSPE
jgi:hypothetical protein